jgi:hypothetical protein
MSNPKSELPEFEPVTRLDPGDPTLLGKPYDEALAIVMGRLIEEFTEYVNTQLLPPLQHLGDATHGALASVMRMYQAAQTENTGGSEPGQHL